MKKNDDCSITESENDVAKSLKNPNPKLAPKAPPKTETTNIIKTRADKIIDLELNI